MAVTGRGQMLECGRVRDYMFRVLRLLFLGGTPIELELG